MCFAKFAMRLVLSGMCLVWSVAQLSAATLSKLTLDDMINQSTAIVRARIAGSYAAARGPVIYTFYQAQILDRWKGADLSNIDVALPGGTANGLRQAFPGTPQLTEGKEYLLFLWTSKSGLTQIIGLTQGLFDVTQDASGVSTVMRGATSNSMLDPRTGALVKDEAIHMQLKDFGVRIATTLGKGATH
jgi:hypothetical protein